MKITFNVTQEDIDKGCSFDRSGCMVARCISRILLYSEIECYAKHLSIHTEPSCRSIELSEKITNAIFNFDIGLSIKPFSFSIEIPDEILEQIGYFDQKGTTTVDDYTKENNIEDKINHDGREVVEACQD